MDITATERMELAQIYHDKAEAMLREARRMKLYQLLGLGDHTQQISRKTMWARAFNQVSICERRKAQGTTV